MTAVFSDFFRTQLFANLGLMSGKQIEIVYFSRYAAFTEGNDPRYTVVKTVTELQQTLGWGAEVGRSVAHTVSTADNGNNRYVIDTNPHTFVTGWSDTRVMAAAVVLKGTYGGVTDPIIFITDSPFTGGTVMRQADSLVALPAVNIGNLAWLFGWQTPAVGATQVLPTEGTLSVLKAPPDYEYSHQQHAWLFPQRVNFLANPSFEGGVNHWRANGTLTQVSGGAPGGGVWEAQATAPVPGYLTATVGTATTPDPGPLPDAFTLVYKVRGPTGGTSQNCIASQWPNSPNNSFMFHRMGGNTNHGFWYSTTGTDSIQRSAAGATITPTSDQYLATSIKLSQFINIPWSSSDGVTWTALSAGVTNPPVPSVFDSTSVIRIGARSNNVEQFQGRIYWAELRTGLDPAAGTVIWRFDANEYPGTGTSYVDPRGRTWTLTSAAAITPKTGTGTGTGCIVESNTFPSQGEAISSNVWTIQAMIKGTGRVRVGLLSWEADYASTYSDWGPDTDVWDLPANGWLHVYALRRVGEGSTAMVRIECDSGAMNLDNLVCEPEWLPGWPYFDGDTTYGALDDYSWYGGENRKGSTYSLWYNHRRSVVGRLFAWNISDDDFTVTDEEVESQGYVYKWVPAGVRVIPHMDVLYVGDPQSPVSAVTGTVLPRSTGPNDQLGVSDAWAGVAS